MARKVVETSIARDMFQFIVGQRTTLHATLERWITPGANGVRRTLSSTMHLATSAARSPGTSAAYAPWGTECPTTRLDVSIANSPVQLKLSSTIAPWNSFESTSIHDHFFLLISPNTLTKASAVSLSNMFERLSSLI
jgi:hypothetical protein